MSVHAYKCIWFLLESPRFQSNFIVLLNIISYSFEVHLAVSLAELSYCYQNGVLLLAIFLLLRICGFTGASMTMQRAS